MTKTKFHNNFSDVYGEMTITGSIILSGDWQPGYLGNNEFISLCPSEFNLNGQSATADMQSGFTGSIELISTPDNGATATMPSVGVGGSGEDALSAIKIIPKGFKATGAVVYGSGANTRWEAHSSNLDIGTAVAQTGIDGSAPDVEDTASFGSEVVGDGSNYIVLKWRPRNPTSLLYGAQIFITPV